MKARLTSAYEAASKEANAGKYKQIYYRKVKHGTSSRRSCFSGESWTKRESEGRSHMEEPYLHN